MEREVTTGEANFSCNFKPQLLGHRQSRRDMVESYETYDRIKRSGRSEPRAARQSLAREMSLGPGELLCAIFSINHTLPSLFCSLLFFRLKKLVFLFKHLIFYSLALYLIFPSHYYISFCYFIPKMSKMFCPSKYLLWRLNKESVTFDKTHRHGYWLIIVCSGPGPGGQNDNTTLQWSGEQDEENNHLMTQFLDGFTSYFPSNLDNLGRGIQCLNILFQDKYQSSCHIHSR